MVMNIIGNTIIKREGNTGEEFYIKKELLLNLVRDMNGFGNIISIKPDINIAEGYSVAKQLVKTILPMAAIIGIGKNILILLVRNNTEKNTENSQHIKTE